ncbi:MAG TPA: MucR family transcriptional regulator [Allosphingosinicella sp.]|jgi:predicted transcriptional regulator
MEANELLTLTADIVSAHVSHNNAAVRDVANSVRPVHETLSTLGQPAPEPTEEKVTIRSSVKFDSIICLICGKKQKTVRRHLQAAHGLTPQQYRSEFELKADYPMTAPNYSETRRTMAKTIGLGRKGRGRATGGGGNASRPAARRRRSSKPQS